MTEETKDTVKQNDVKDSDMDMAVVKNFTFKERLAWAKRQKDFFESEKAKVMVKLNLISMILLINTKDIERCEEAIAEGLGDEKPIKDDEGFKKDMDNLKPETLPEELQDKEGTEI